MVMRYEREFMIEDPRHHTAETVSILRKLLAGGARVEPDPKRPDFYEVESGATVYYIHVSPVTGKILLLATWPSETASVGAAQAA
jgi:hypothetical protein